MIENFSNYKKVETTLFERFNSRKVGCVQLGRILEIFVVTTLKHQYSSVQNGNSSKMKNLQKPLKQRNNECEFKCD